MCFNPTPLDVNVGERDINKRLIEGVSNSKGLLLLQTEHSYQDPLTLLELYWAVRSCKPIICIRLEGSTYNFSDARAYLEHLDDELHAHQPWAAAVIVDWLSLQTALEHCTMEHMRQTLATVMPAIVTIPVPFSPTASDNQIGAALKDIMERLEVELMYADPQDNVLQFIERSTAAKKMQAAFRGRLARKEIATLWRTATKLQAWTRGTLTRRAQRATPTEVWAEVRSVSDA